MNNVYPNINIRSKNEIAKRLSTANYSKKEALADINECLSNMDALWKDSNSSNPEKGKYVRNASHTKLGKILRGIDRRILAPYDAKLPSFIHGSIKGKNIKSAALVHLGHHKKRTVLKIDLRRYYEHITEEDVISTFCKMGCTPETCRILAKICCVNEGAKNNPLDGRVLARGFATSGRIAAWCNLIVFNRIFWLMKKVLKNNDPVMTVYVDDINITASNVSPKQMADLYFKIRDLIRKYGNNKLEVNDDKTKIINYRNRKYDLNGQFIGHAQYEVLGIKLERNSLKIGAKTKAKYRRLKDNGYSNSKKKCSLKSLRMYAAYIET